MKVGVFFVVCESFCIFALRIRLKRLFSWYYDLINWFLVVRSAVKLGAFLLCMWVKMRTFVAIKNIIL